MKIEKASNIRINQLSMEDHDALKVVEELLVKMTKYYGEGITLMSPNTGEVIQIEELARVRGILGFIQENRVVEISWEERALPSLFLAARGRRPRAEFTNMGANRYFLKTKSKIKNKKIFSQNLLTSAYPYDIISTTPSKSLRPQAWAVSPPVPILKKPNIQ